MARKKDTDLGNFDLDDFDLDFNIADNPPVNTKDRNPVVNVTANAYKGFKSTVANRGFVARVLRKAAPKGFVDAFDSAERVATQGRKLYNGVAQDVRPAWNDFNRATRDVLPAIRRSGKGGLADRISKLLGDAPQSSSQQSLQDSRDQQIQDSLGNLFLAQAEDKDKTDLENKASEQVKERTVQKRHMDSMNQAVVTAEGINSLVGYQQNITSKYQRKMLELNYHQVYVQRDILGAFQGYAKDTNTQLESIIKNSALPDIIKMQASEQFLNQARQRAFGKVQEGVGNYFGNYTDKLFENITKAVNVQKDKLISGLQMGAMGMDAYGMSSEFDDGSGGQGVGGVAGKGLGYLAGHALGKFGNKVLGKNRDVQNKAAKFGYYAKNYPEFLNDLKNDREVRTGWRGVAMDGLKSVLPGSFQRETELSGADGMGGFGANSFDNSTHKSINDIIPGYLSRILQSLEISRTGRDTGRLVFNHEKNAFTTQRQRAADIGEAIMGAEKVKSVQSTADSMIDRMDPDGKLSSSARMALKNTLLREADAGNSFSPSRLGSGQVDFQSDDSTSKELREHLKSRYGITDEGKMGGEAEHYNRASLDNSSFNSLRKEMPDVYATIHRMVATGNSEDLRALGILKRDPKDPSKEIIDYAFIQSRLQGGNWNIDDALGGSKKGSRFGNKGSQSSQVASADIRGWGSTPPPAPGGTVGLDMATPIIEALTKMTGSIGASITAAAELTGTNIETHSAKTPAEEALVWLQRIAESVRGMNNYSGAAGFKQTAEGDWDWDDTWNKFGGAGGDIFDSARRGYHSGKSKIKGAASRMAERASSAGKYAKDKVRSGFQGALMLGPDLLRHGINKAVGGVQQIYNSTQEVFDIYVKGQEEPVITAAKLRAGKYFDFHSRKPIYKFSDIKGAVCDEEGNVILSEQDIRNGLTDKHGNPIAGNLLRGLVGLVKGAGNLYAQALLFPLTASKWIGKQIVKTFDGPEDVYVVGEESPRLMAIVMARGGYMSKTSRRLVNKPSDIDGEVIDVSGNTVLSFEDLKKGLVDNKGRPFQTLRGKIWGLIKSGVGLAGSVVGGVLNAAKKTMSYAWDKAKKVGSAIGHAGKTIWGGLTKGINFQANIGLGIGGGGTEPIVSGLEAIYTLLDERLPGQRSYRRNSWQDKEQKRLNAPGKTPMEKIKKAADENPILKYLMMFGGAVITGFTWLKSKFTDFFGLMAKKKILDAGVDALDGLDAAGGTRKGGKKPGKLARLGKGLWKGAKAVGSLAWKAGAAILPFAGEAIAGAASFVSAPVLLGVAAVVAVGAAGYYTYKYFKNKPDDLQRLRLAEYGFEPGDGSAMKKVLELEGYLLPQVSVSGTSAVLNVRNTEELISRAGIGDDLTEQQNFTNWFLTRFKPVFLRNVLALNKVSSNTSLLEVYDKLDKSLFVDYAEGTRHPKGDPNYPYDVVTPPFAGINMQGGTAAIDSELSAIRSAYGKYRKERSETVKETKTSEAAAASSSTGSKIATAATVGNNPEFKNSGTYEPSADTYSTPTAETGGYAPGVTVQNWSPAANRLIDDLTAIRMRLYGLIALDVNQVNALTTLETNVQEYITISSTGAVSLSTSAEAIYRANAALFGRNPNDPGQMGEWLSWFNYRFLPVYSQFVSAVWTVNKSISPNLAWKSLGVEDSLSIAELLKGVKVKTDSGEISVWSIKVSPFAGMESNGDISSIDANLVSMRNMIRNNTYREQTGGNASATGGTSGSNMAAAAGVPPQKDGVTGGGSKFSIWKPSTWFGGGDEKGSSANTGQSQGPGGAMGGSVGGVGNGTPSGPMGTQIQQPGNGTGGDINQIPLPEGDGNWNAVKKTIVSAAIMAGVDPGLMAAMAFVESNFQAAVKPGTSRAQGLYQFIPSTWKSMLQKYGSKYGISPNTSPSDPRANALMGAEYLKENQKILESKLGRPVTGTDLYASHFLGGGGGPRLLKAPSGDLAMNHAEAAQVSANKTVFYSGGRPRTVGEVISWMNKRIESDGGSYSSDAKSLAQSLGGKLPSAENTPADPGAAPAPDVSSNGSNGNEGSNTDGTQAAQASAAMAAKINSNGLPTGAPAPAVSGAGGVTATAPSTIPGSVGSDQVLPSEDPSLYVSEVQTNARTEQQSEEYQNNSAFQSESLKVQNKMSSTLEKILAALTKEPTQSEINNGLRTTPKPGIPGDKTSSLKVGAPAGMPDNTPPVIGPISMSR